MRPARAAIAAVEPTRFLTLPGAEHAKNMRLGSFEAIAALLADARKR